MSTRNNVRLIGNLGKDPELKTLSSGTVMTTFSLAVNKRFKNKTSGEWEKGTDWFNLALFGKRAEAMAKIGKKGMTLAIDGELNTKQEQIGEKKYSMLRIYVTDFEILASKSSGGGGGSPRQEEMPDVGSEDEGDEYPSDDEGPF